MIYARHTLGYRKTGNLDVRRVKAQSLNRFTSD